MSAFDLHDVAPWLRVPPTKSPQFLRGSLRSKGQHYPGFFDRPYMTAAPSLGMAVIQCHKVANLNLVVIHGFLSPFNVTDLQPSELPTCRIFWLSLSESLAMRPGLFVVIAQLQS